jgi:hypothetical protein
MDHITDRRATGHPPITDQRAMDHITEQRAMGHLTIADQRAMAHRVGIAITRIRPRRRHRE